MEKEDLVEKKVNMIKKDFEIKYGTNLEAVKNVDGIIVSKNYVIPHLVVYNIDPIDYSRFIAFTKSEANGKGYRALKLLLDLADMKNAVLAKTSSKEGAESPKTESSKLVKVCGREKNEQV